MVHRTSDTDDAVAPPATATSCLTPSGKHGPAMSPFRQWGSCGQGRGADLGSTAASLIQSASAPGGMRSKPRAVGGSPPAPLFLDTSRIRQHFAAASAARSAGSPSQVPSETQWDLLRRVVSACCSTAGATSQVNQDGEGNFHEAAIGGSCGDLGVHADGGYAGLSSPTHGGPRPGMREHQGRSTEGLLRGRPGVGLDRVEPRHKGPLEELVSPGWS